MTQSDPSIGELSALSAPLRRVLAQKLLAMADDELILAHRNSEWCGHAPILEEDIAFANIAQDELGHAGLWYGLLQQLDSSEPDQLVYFRSTSSFRNARMLELPNDDWALSMLRQYLFDSYEMLLLQKLTASVLPPLAQVAAKMQREEVYHLRHTSSWVQRLGLGTVESQRRMQAALNKLWPLAQQLFLPLEDEARLVDAAIVPSLQELSSLWTEDVTTFLSACDLQPPGEEVGQRSLRGREVHTEHLPPLIEELQSVARADPQASW